MHDYHLIKAIMDPVVHSMDWVASIVGAMLGFLAAILAAEFRFVKRADFKDAMGSNSEEHREIKVVVERSRTESNEHIKSVQKRLDYNHGLLYRIAGKLGINGPSDNENII